MNGCRPLRGLLRCVLRQSWGSAALHPRLYAIAALRGLGESERKYHWPHGRRPDDNKARRSYSLSINPVLGTGCTDSGTVNSSCLSASRTASSGTSLSATSFTNRTLMAAKVRNTPPAITTYIGALGLSGPKTARITGPKANDAIISGITMK